eukprot:s1232_g12.t1
MRQISWSGHIHANKFALFTALYLRRCFVDVVLHPSETAGKRARARASERERERERKRERQRERGSAGTSLLGSSSKSSDQDCAALQDSVQWCFRVEPVARIVQQRGALYLEPCLFPPVNLARASAKPMTAKWQAKLFQLSRMINSCHQPDKDVVRKVANATISVCGKSQRWDWSLHLVSAMQFQQRLANGCSLPEPDTVSYGAIISVLGKTVRWQRALLLLHECDAGKAKGKAVKGREAARPGPAASVEAGPGKFGKICRGRSKADRAYRTPDLVCFNAAMAACGQGLQWLKAGAVLTAMVERNITPDAVSISTLLTTFGNAMLWQLALWHFSSFPFPPASPFSRMFHDVVTLSSAISACEKGRQWQAALSLLTRAMTGEICAAAISLPSTPSEPSSSLKPPSLFPDDVSFNAAIVACEGCSQWEFAVHLLTELSFWSTPAPTCYATTMKAMSAASKWHHALALLKRLTPSSCRSSLSSTENVCEHRFVDGFGWGSLLTALHVTPEKLPKMLGDLVRQVFRFCPGRRALDLRRGAEVAELLCLLNWVQVLGVSDSSAISRFLRCKVVGHANIFACRNRNSVPHLPHLNNLGRFAGDMLESQGFKFCAWSEMQRCQGMTRGGGTL